MLNFYEKSIKERFKARKSFTRQELYSFYQEYEPDLKEATFGWRIFDLCQKGIISSVGKGIYTLSSKREYRPNLNAKTRSIVRLFLRKLSGSNYCISDTSWLNEFSIHQTNFSTTILEVEKELINSAFYTLKEEVKNLYLQPNEKEMEMYVLEKEDPVILKPLISRSPTQRIQDKNLTIFLPQLEKLLVDVYCDRQIYFFYSGAELKNIFNNAFDRYTVNLSRLRSYAKRRGKGREIEEFLSHEASSSQERALR